MVPPGYFCLNCQNFHKVHQIKLTLTDVIVTSVRIKESGDVAENALYWIPQEPKETIGK